MNYKNFEFHHSGATITHTRETYHPTRGGWSVKPDTVTAETVTETFYNNFVTATPFFNSRVKWAYTDAGRLPVELVTVSPDQSIKYVDKFNISISGEGVKK